MATITATNAQANIAAKFLHAGVVAVESVYSIGAALSNGDVLQMVKVPSGAKVLDVMLVVDHQNSAAVFNVGDGADVDRYIASRSISGVATLNTLVGLGYSYSAEDTIDIQAVVTTATAVGSLRLRVMYQLDQL